VPLECRASFWKGSLERGDDERETSDLQRRTFLCLHSSHLRRSVSQIRSCKSLPGSSSLSCEGAGEADARSLESKEDGDIARCCDAAEHRRRVWGERTHETDIGRRCLLRGGPPFSVALSSSSWL
jgi:hypothetical protein